jgi:hypothetical protein
MMQRRRKWRTGHGLVSIIESFFDIMQENTNLKKDLARKEKINKSLSGLEDKP